jgi:tetratricopeptide (TPR) repeat protein
MKALEKDRNRRYETANGFAADVMHYLTDQPVEACPPSAWYRLSKFTRRNRVALTTASVVGIALIAGTGVSLWQAQVARQAQRRAASEAAIARAVNNFLQTDLLGEADEYGTGQDSNGGSPMTVREALDRASAQIGDRFRDQPLVEASIRMTIGTAYHRVRQPRLGVPHLERALAIRRMCLGADHPETLSSMDQLAGAYSWTGRFQDLIVLRSQLLELRKAGLGPDNPETLACLAKLAAAYQCAGQWDVSNQLFEDLIDRERAILGPAHSQTLDSMHLLAMNYAETDRLAQSIALHEEVLRLNETANGPRHNSSLWERMTLAQVCQRAGQLDRAEQLLDEALEIQLVTGRQRGDSPRQRLGIANVRGWQALNLLLRRRYAEAERLAREAEAVWAEICPENQRRFYLMSVRGAALCGLGQYAEAEPLLLRAYEGMKKQGAVTPAVEWRRLTEACERVSRFYEVTNQREKARAWRETLAFSHSDL